MQYGTSPELEEFRIEVRSFIAEHAPAIPPRAGVRSAQNDTEHRMLADWTARLYDSGYVGADWPAEFGGRADRTTEHAVIVGRSWPALGCRGRRAAACWHRMP